MCGVKWNTILHRQNAGFHLNCDDDGLDVAELELWFDFALAGDTAMAGRLVRFVTRTSSSTRNEPDELELDPTSGGEGTLIDLAKAELVAGSLIDFANCCLFDGAELERSAGDRRNGFAMRSTWLRELALRGGEELELDGNWIVTGSTSGLSKKK